MKVQPRQTFIVHFSIELGLSVSCTKIPVSRRYISDFYSITIDAEAARESGEEKNNFLRTTREWNKSQSPIISALLVTALVLEGLSHPELTTLSFG